jgi:cellulose synthase/poly-beta-1,6-N-acetylglucosamine synthase-like glycosyltransferase
MTAAYLAEAVQWGLLLYFAAFNLGYLVLTVLSVTGLRSRLLGSDLEALPSGHAHRSLPISVLVPAYNEQSTIVASVRALLQLDYPQYEIIVISDGSSDASLERLIAEFGLQPFPEAYRIRLSTQPVRGIYRSTRHANLRVIDKLNGGKADALNCGINAARYPLICSVDADSILQPDSLRRIVRPMVLDAHVVACGGTVRVANGCKLRRGIVESVGLPRRLISLLQITEYLRAFLFGRLGWAPLNALLIVSGAFGLFRKEAVVSAGGYRTDCVGEDMELIVRLHRLLVAQRKRYRIEFVPDPVCWTEAPESWRVLRSQRMRWQRGLAESLTLNRPLCFQRGSGAAGWLAYPFFMLFELCGPVIEVGGYLFVGLSFAMGWLTWQAAVAFIVISVGLGMLLSTSALLLEELSFHVFPKVRHLVALFAVALLENLGYRQLLAAWRLVGLSQWLRRKPARWGTMQRSAEWHLATGLAQRGPLPNSPLMPVSSPGLPPLPLPDAAEPSKSDR